MARHPRTANQRLLSAPRRFPRSSDGHLRLAYRLLLALIHVSATAVRFAGINWGGSAYLHPDERFMPMVTIGIEWPRFFLAKLLGAITGNVVYGDSHEPARWLSALLDVGSVAIAFGIARHLFSPAAGLIAATFVAFAPLNIRAAHYYTTDSTATFVAVADLATVLEAWFRHSW